MDISEAIPPSHPGVPERPWLFLTAFLAGACVMVVELAGGRLLATWFGNSLFTWTGLIGIILVAMSAGSYLGGYLADKGSQVEARPLAHILLLSGIWAALIPLVHRLIDGAFSHSHVIWGPLLASTILFAIPALLLGTVSPFITRLNSLWSEDHLIGHAAGSIGMLATLGSVIGTFLTGLVLIPHIRIDFIYYATGLILALLSVAHYLSAMGPELAAKGLKAFSTKAMIIFFMVDAVLAALIPYYIKGEEKDPHVIYEQQTFYHRIRVYSHPMPNGDTLTQLGLDTTSEGGRYAISKEMPLDYQRYWELIRYFKRDPVKRAAFLGGGAFLMPLVLLDNFKEARADVVEIDPAVVKVGETYFQAASNERMKTVVDDARRFLFLNQHEQDKKYDFIFGDTYNGIRYIPAHFVTKEFFTLVKNNLSPGGVFMMNIISSISGEKSVLFQSIMKTLQSVFPHTYVFATRWNTLEQTQNILLVGSDVQVGTSHEDFQAALARNQITYEVFEYLSAFIPPSDYVLSSGEVFTDLFNPVEFIVAKGLLND